MPFYRCDLGRNPELIEINQNTGRPNATSTGQEAPYGYTIDITNYRDTINVKNYIETNNLPINYAALTADDFVFKPITPSEYVIQDDLTSYGAGGNFHGSSWVTGDFAEVKEYNATTGVLSYRSPMKAVELQRKDINNCVINGEPGSGADSTYRYYTHSLFYNVGHVCIMQ